MKFKVFNQGSDEIADDFDPFSIPVAIGSKGDCTDLKGAIGILDTGADTCAVSFSHLERLGLEASPVGEQKIEVANGDESEAKIVLLDFRIVTGDGATNVIASVPFVILEEGSSLLIGMNVLRFFDFTFAKRKIIGFVANELFDDLPDFEHPVTEHRKSDLAANNTSTPRSRLPGSNLMGGATVPKIPGIKSPKSKLKPFSPVPSSSFPSQCDCKVIQDRLNLIEKKLGISK